MALLVICVVLQNCGQDGGRLGFDSNFKFSRKTGEMEHIFC